MHTDNPIWSVHPGTHNRWMLVWSVHPESLLVDVSVEEQLVRGIFPTTYRADLPFTWSESIKILGVVFDPWFSFASHLESILCRAKVRHSVLARLAKSNWGLETNILRTTHNALLVNLTRYGLASTGSSMYESTFRQLDTRDHNIPARRIVGLGPSARIETLFHTAGILNVRNLYLRCCGGMLDRALRAWASSIRTRMDRWLCNVFGVSTWTSAPGRVTPALAQRSPRRRREGIFEYDVGEEWFCNALERIPRLPDRFRIPSVFHTNAPEITPNAILQNQTYNFQRASMWFEVGLQTLSRSGWRPDCTMADSLDISKILPPPHRGNYPFVVGSYDVMNWVPTPDFGCTNDIPLPDPTHLLDIEVVTFFEKGYAFSCSYLCSPSLDISCQGWIFGQDTVREQTPFFVFEFAIFHGCNLALKFLQDVESSRSEGETNQDLQLSPTLIQIRAGSDMACSQILGWFNEGKCGVKSAIGSAIVSCIIQLNSILRCPLILTSSEVVKKQDGA